MKKILIGIICILSLSICLFACLKHPLSVAPQLSKSDCNEFGMCKEGLTAIINGENFVINKETCLKYNKQWREDLKACYMR